MKEKILALKEYFYSKGISQNDIAEILGCSYAYVNALLSGRKAFGKNQAKRFEEKFGISSVWLLTQKGSMLLESNSTPTISVIGNNNVSGVNNRVEKAENAALLDELAAQRLLTEKAVNQLAETQRQMASLLSILEKVTTSDK